MLPPVKGLFLAFYEYPISVAGKESYSQDEVMKEIDSFSALPNGWSYGDGDKFRPSLIRTAKIIYQIGKTFGFAGEPHPNKDGSITIVFYKDDLFLDIRIDKKLVMHARFEIGRGKDYKIIWKDRNINYTDLIQTFLEINAQWRNISLGLSTSNITAQVNSDFKTMKSSEITKEEYQYSIRTAQMPQEIAFASI